MREIVRVLKSKSRSKETFSSVIVTSYKNCTRFLVARWRKCNRPSFFPYSSNRLQPFSAGVLNSMFKASVVGLGENILCPKISWSMYMVDGDFRAKKTKFSVHDRSDKRCSYSTNLRTFFSDSIHLLIAATEDPVRSFRAPIASLMIPIVAIVLFSWG